MTTLAINRAAKRAAAKAIRDGLTVALYRAEGYRALTPDVIGEIERDLGRYMADDDVAEFWYIFGSEIEWEAPMEETDHEC